MFGPVYKRKEGEIQPGINLHVFNLVLRLPFIIALNGLIMFKGCCYVPFVSASSQYCKNI